MTASRNPAPRSGTAIADLRGLARLAVDAVEGGSRIVEGVHQSVWDTLGMSGAAPGQTGGITGFAYRGVRSVARFAGGTADRLLAPWAERHAADQAEAGQSPSRVAAVAALNGVMAITSRPRAIRWRRPWACAGASMRRTQRRSRRRTKCQARCCS